MGCQWTFYGYQTPAGNRPVSEWIAGLPQEAIDEFVDVVSYLQIRPNHEWPPEYFKPLEDRISKVRFSNQDHWYRIYGCFGPHREGYIFLLGTDKKVRNQRHAKNLSRERRDQIERGEARVYELRIEE